LSQWPYPAGVIPQPDSVDHELRFDQDEIISEVPTCRHCGSENLANNGSYTSKRWNEKRQQILCRSCHRVSYLPLGVWLPRDEMASPHGSSRPRKSRPTATCDCGSVDLKSRGFRMSGGGRQLAECMTCGKRIVLDPGVEIPGGRNADREQHWQLPDVSEEANALFIAAKSEDDFEGMREIIGYTEAEKKCLELLSAQGVLANGYEALLRFRDDVLDKFNSLVNIELQMLVEKEGQQISAALESRLPRLAMTGHALPNHTVTDRTRFKSFSSGDGTLPQIAEKES
jgi:hypothetical protein